jgi:hypothetical protein
MSTPFARRLCIAGVASWSMAVPAWGLPVSLDADGDGWANPVESRLGSDPNDAAKTPESVAVAGSCFDGLDNDGDGQTDDADPGCTAPKPSDTTFPDAGSDAFDSSLSLDGYPFALDIPGTMICKIDLDAGGPVVVERGAPAGTPRQIPVEIVAMQLTGTGTVRPDSSGCPLPPGDYPITVVEDPAQSSVGRVTAAGPGSDFPADSFFDVFFQVDVKSDGTDIVVPGGRPSGPPGTPVRVTNTIHTIPPYQGGKNTLCYDVPGQPHQHCPKAPPDHYLCYAGKFPRFQKRDVTLKDQFDDTAGRRARVLKPLLFCNPASKNGEPLYEPTGHLKCYAVKPEKTERTVVVRNQFGQNMNVTTKKSRLLCLPTEKNQEGPPQQLDHFKCYTGKFPKFSPRNVTLVDQFGTLQTQVRKPLVLCNPVSKDGGPIHNPLNHLECYGVTPRPVRQTVTANNQFGQETVKTKKAVMLCLPSGKSEAAPTTTTTRQGTTTTSTTLPGITVMLAWTHTVPGVYSTLCGKVNGPPNTSCSVQIQGPPSNSGTTSAQLDGTGVGRFSQQITSYGAYTANVDCGGVMGSAMTTVDQNDPGCP